MFPFNDSLISKFLAGSGGTNVIGVDQEGKKPMMPKSK
jgi:hypothetical protein